MPRTCRACKQGSTEVHPSRGVIPTRVSKASDAMVTSFQSWIEEPRAPSVASIPTHIEALNVLSPPIARCCNSRAQARCSHFCIHLVRGVLQVHTSFLVPLLCPTPLQLHAKQKHTFFTLSSHLQLTGLGVFYATFKAIVLCESRGIYQDTCKVVEYIELYTRYTASHTMCMQK